MAVAGIDFVVPAGRLFTLLGPSGCGKTTTMRMIAGLERPSAGRILIAGEVVCDCEADIFIPAHRRPIGMVFQSYAIWPHMTVCENVGFPLTVGPRVPRDEVRRRALRMLDIVGLADHADRSATKLSGGQQQRVALARALVREPKVLLFDEPLSNLDAQLRERMRTEIRQLQQQLGITAIYVTHDQSEALAISDFIMLMNHGKIVESGIPSAMYSRPSHEFTANFIGVANALDGVVRALDDRGAIVEGVHGVMRATAPADVRLGDSVRVIIRPESFDLSRDRLDPTDLVGTILNGTYQGDSNHYAVEVNGLELRVHVYRDPGELRPGDVVYLRARVEETLLLASHPI
jgi:iron(III) transport system ATP-binding protein